MRTRRLLSSFTGSVIVAALMGCNAIVGTDEIDYFDPTEAPDDEPGSNEPDSNANGRDADADAPRDGDADAYLEDGPLGDGGAFDDVVSD